MVLNVEIQMISSLVLHMEIQLIFKKNGIKFGNQDFQMYSVLHIVK